MICCPKCGAEAVLTVQPWKAPWIFDDRGNGEKIQVICTGCAFSGAAATWDNWPDFTGHITSKAEAEGNAIQLFMRGITEPERIAEIRGKWHTK